MPVVLRPRKKNLVGRQQFRIVPDRFRAISLFEEFSTADELEVAWSIANRTNDLSGDLYRVNRNDWLTGPGAGVVMAAFTLESFPSRFSTGNYGVYYAALDIETAIKETVFHRERILRESEHDPIEIAMRCYVGTIQKPLEDIRGAGYERLRDPSMDTYQVCQLFGQERRDDQSWGLLYQSARNPGGECIGVFRPPAVSAPQPRTYYRYCFNGERIETILTAHQL